MNGIFELGHVDNAPFSKDVNTNFLNSPAYTRHRLPVARFNSALNGKEFKTSCFARFSGKIPKIVQTRTYEIKRLH